MRLPESCSLHTKRWRFSPLLGFPRGARGFTLLELSIVITIIGLLIGSIMVGRVLITAANTNATIAQIQTYESAVSAFRDQYGALPGDIPPRLVTAFNFTVVPTRNGAAGRGDGNGVLQGYNYTAPVTESIGQGGETVWFWEDLASNASMIEGGFNYSSDTAYSVAILSSSTTLGLNLLFPMAKLKRNNFIYVYSNNGINYYNIAAVAYVDQNNHAYSGPGLSVLQAYNIDKKMDDGLPQSGKVTAQYVNETVNAFGPVWAIYYPPATPAQGASGTAATPGTQFTCYDNGNSATNAPQLYSMEEYNGEGINCALSFQFP